MGGRRRCQFDAGGRFTHRSMNMSKSETNNSKKTVPVITGTVKQWMFGHHSPDTSCYTKPNQKKTCAQVKHNVDPSRKIHSFGWTITLCMGFHGKLEPLLSWQRVECASASNQHLIDCRIIAVDILNHVHHYFSLQRQCIITHRIHGAGIYANITGVYSW